MFFSSYNDALDRSRLNTLRIVFIGGGASNTFALLRLLKSLEAAANHQLLDHWCRFSTIKIVFVNANDNFASGLAYGKTHPIFLLNTPVRMLEPQREFEQWFIDSKDWVVAKLTELAGGENPLWLKDLLLQLKNADISEVNLPRMVYGAFLREEFQKVFSLIENVNKAGKTHIEMTVLKTSVDRIRKREEVFYLSIRNQRAEVISIDRCQDGDIHFSTKDFIKISEDGIEADIVILGIGFESNSYLSLCNAQGYFPSIYKPGIKAIHQWIMRHPDKAVEVALLGTKSAALDFIRYVNYTPSLLQKIKIKAISSSGQTRYPAKRSIDKPEYLPLLMSNNIHKVTNATSFLELLEKEIFIGQSRGYTRLDICRSVMRGKYRELARKNLPINERRKLDREGNEKIRTLFSFTDTNSIEAFHKLRLMGTLCVEKGRIDNITYELSDVHPFSISATSDEGSKKTTADVVINCTGAARIQNCRASVLKDIVGGGLALINESGMGFQTSANREASPNFFIVGPLTSGGEITNRQGQVRYQSARHTLPYILEDADIVGETIAEYIMQKQKHKKR